LVEIISSSEGNLHPTLGQLLLSIYRYIRMSKIAAISQEIPLASAGSPEENNTLSNYSFNWFPREGCCKVGGTLITVILRSYA
jgi:hypothetical protein